MKQISLLLSLLCCTIMNVASQPQQFTDVWFMPGLSYKFSRATTLQSQVIYLTGRQAMAIYTQAFIKKGTHIILNPGYLYLNKGVTGNTEHTLMNGLIITGKFGKLGIDLRNIIWNRLRSHQADLHFYRPRLKLKWPVITGRYEFNIYIFDEAFYLFNDGKWNRNRLAAGCEYNAFSFLSLDFAFVRQTDGNGAEANLLFVSCTVKLARKKT